VKNDLLCTAYSIFFPNFVYDAMMMMMMMLMTTTTTTTTIITVIVSYDVLFHVGGKFE
jgi:hypothetical protein